MKVLIALDDSPVSAQAARVAASLFSTIGAEFVVIKVLDLHAPWFLATGFGIVAPLERTGPSLDSTLPEDDAAKADLMERAQAADVPDPVVAVRTGDAVTEICTLADEEEVDLIVVGSHDKTVLRRLIDPSVAAGVVRQTYRPVLVVSGAPRQRRLTRFLADLTNFTTVLLALLALLLTQDAKGHGGGEGDQG